jgi:putative membrane protein
MGVATDDSLNRSMNNAQRHYSSLFFLPSFKKAIVAIAAICFASGLLSVLFFPSSGGLTVGLLLGAALFAVNFAADLFLSKIVLKDLIFTVRRTVVLSLFSWLFWLLFLVLGVGLGSLFGSVWVVKLCLLGFATLITLRAVVFLSVSSAGLGKRVTAILLQPISCIIVFAVFWARLNVAPLDFLPFIIVAPAIACISALVFVRLLDQIGQKTYGVPSISIFKAFMLNWVSALNAPLESYLEKMGSDADVEVSLLKFDSAKPKAAIIVPLVHPGPFKNIGSSLLPSLLKEAFEKEYGVDACVPLGLLGHELDAASQAQNQKIISYVLSSARFEATIDKATPVVRVSEGFVTVSCQVFGKTALLSFTLAPKTTEDLPQELGSIVREEAKRLGLDFAIVVNAHNSLTNSVEIEASLETLSDVAAKCLQKAVLQKSYTFEAGTATIHPPDFTLKDGMGTGGITAVVIKVAEQKTAYVVIDGNNMVPGLRELVLSSLGSLGFEGSEVFTTDTHAVSAVVVGRRGYHPIGEAMDQEKLINYIKDLARKAEGQLESCRAGYQRIIVPKVRVLGGDCLGFMTVLVDKTIQKAKKIVLPIFALEGVLLILLLAFL